MRKVILTVVILSFLAVPVAAEEITAPTVPKSAQAVMPEKPESFMEGVAEILRQVLPKVQPALAEGLQVCVCVVAAAVFLSVVQTFTGKQTHTIHLAGAVAIGVLMLGAANSMIALGADAVTDLSEYGKLLLPMMAAAMAAGGGTTTSAALYAGTALFDSILSTAITGILIPLVYVFLCLAVASAAVGADVLKELKGTLKWLMTWCLKTILYIFTGYMGITGVISGSADAAAIKATKLTISGMVPVVGNILSDASEAVLVSADLVKNSVGIYGLLAVISIWISPFLEIGVQYLLLKVTAAISGVFAPKPVASLIQDFSSAMGFLLAMTGSVCLLLMISTVCFMKGVG